MWAASCFTVLEHVESEITHHYNTTLSTCPCLNGLRSSFKLWPFKNFKWQTRMSASFLSSLRQLCVGIVQGWIIVKTHKWILLIDPEFHFLNTSWGLCDGSFRFDLWQTISWNSQVGLVYIYRRIYPANRKFLQDISCLVSDTASPFWDGNSKRSWGFFHHSFPS